MADVLDEEFSTFVGEETSSILAPVWLTAEEESSFAEWKQELPYVLTVYTLLFIGMHMLSVLLTGSMDTSGMAAKDRKLWHNKVVSATHAALACVLAVYWFMFSGEPALLRQRTFVFLPGNAHIAAFGAGYFIYDFFAMVALRTTMNASFFWGVMVHHVIFILAYFSTIMIPCALSVSTYHLFQLTELSTVFLHLSWMASKSQVQYATLFQVSMTLLGTFVIRVLTNAYIVFHVVTRLMELALWEKDIPNVSWAASIAYSGFFVAGAAGMMYINFTWFNQLINRAKSMIDRVQKGLPPTPDYERPHRPEGADDSGPSDGSTSNGQANSSTNNQKAQKAE